MKRISLLEGILVSIPLTVLGASANPDESFFDAAARGGLAEVSDGMLAQKQGSSQEVRDFGALMVKDHTEANEKLRSIAAAESVSLPSSAGATRTAAHLRLKALSGASFDKAYMQGQIDSHQDTVALFKKEKATGQDAQAKQFAADTLPTIENHLKKARSTYDGLQGR